jgi:hypothetical protein
MSKVYVKYIPVRRGLTGAEYMAQWLDENYNGVTFTGVISDGMAHFGMLEGTGEIFMKAIAAVEGRFSMAKLTEDEFIGVVKKHYNPGTLPDGGDPPTFVEYMDSVCGLTVSATPLDEYKAQKKSLLKELAKKKFSTLNDALSDVAKSVVLLTQWYDELTPGAEKDGVDANIATLKGIYSKAICIGAFDDMVTELSTILGDYYTAKTAVDGAADEAAVDAVTYE